MKDKYFDFLCEIVGEKDNYSYLLRQLFKTEFYSIVPNDDNREIDGEQLRLLFINEEGQQALSFLPTTSCSLLEMLIALSMRLEFESVQSYWEKKPNEWFWILIDNLELTIFNNETYNKFPFECRRGVNDICFKLLQRKYKSNGKGGLFPLKKQKQDQRKVEIWYQMSAYILENFSLKKEVL